MKKKPYFYAVVVNYVERIILLQRGKNVEFLNLKFLLKF